MVDLIGCTQVEVSITFHRQDGNRDVFTGKINPSLMNFSLDNYPRYITLTGEHTGSTMFNIDEFMWWCFYHENSFIRQHSFNKR